MRQPISDFLIALTGLLATLACYFAPFSSYSHWVGWCLWGFLCSFLLPLGMLLAVGKKPWECGLTVGEGRLGLLWVAIGTLGMAFIGQWAAGRPDFRAYYEPLAASLRSAPLTFWLTLFAYMLGWEFLFRGFLLFGLAGNNPSLLRLLTAVTFSTLLFGASHWGKPLPELLGSFLAGLILCGIAWRTRSLFAPVLLHTLVFGIFTTQVARVSRLSP
ncbi:MAG: hypothetical protein LKKZDAJK_002277 [Candidatus Fervidibacter sp.]